MNNRIQNLLDPVSERSVRPPNPVVRRIAVRGQEKTAPSGGLHARLPAVGPKTSKSMLAQLQDPSNLGVWDRFWTLYEPLIRMYLRRLKVRDQDFDDVVNDLFIKLKVQLPKFKLDEAKGMFRGWLRRVTDHHILDFYRAEQRRAKLMAEAATYMAALQKALDDTPLADKEREEAWKKNIDALVLEKVRHEFRKRQTTLACFEKVMLEGRAPKDVAAELGMDKVNTVYVYCKRVMDRIEDVRQAYDEAYEYDPEVADAPDDLP